MRTYDTYNDSGISWLGQIPSHWELKPGFSLYHVNNEKFDMLSEPTVLSLSYGNIIVKKNKDEGLVPENYSGYQVIKPDYIIIRCTDLQNDKVSLRTGIAKNHGIITGAYLGLIAKDGFNAQYLHYFLHDWDITKEIYRHGSGLRQVLSWNDMKRLPILVPPLAEQEAIVAYLDRATAEIDKAIASQQRMVELLQERKQIIINQAVTQGLNPDAPMKPTNINYIGNVPAHWQITQFKRGISKLTDYTANGSFGDLARNVQYLDYPEYSRLIRLTDLRENLKNDKCVWVNKRSHDYLSKSELFGGELLIANVGAYSGYSCIMPKTNLKCTLGPNMELIECNQLLLNEYASLVLNSKSFFNHLQMVAISSAQPKLNKNDIKSIFFLFPPIKEQEEIIEYIKITTKPIDAEITRCEQKIALLTERKQILINDVVTGKIKVI